MDFKSIFIFYIALICVKTRDVEETNNEAQCFDIYDCCRKDGIDCVEYCKLKVVCSNNGTTEDLRYIEINLESSQETVRETTEAVTQVYEESSTQAIQDTNIITVGVCRKGYRRTTNGCKRVV